MASQQIGDSTSQIEKAKSALSSLSIPCEVIAHKAVMTAEEHLAALGSVVDAQNIPVKNLFLKDKKSKLWLLVIPNDRQLNLKAVPKQIGASGDCRFEKAETLEAVLGVKQGHVTPLAVMNDNSKQVTVVVDKTLEKDDLTLLVHPLSNEATIRITSANLKKFFAHYGTEYKYVDFTAEVAAAPKEEKKEAKKDAKKPKKEEEKKADTIGVGYPKNLRYFAKWYQDVITKSEMIDYYEISGCYILRPHAYLIWEKIVNFFDSSIKQLKPPVRNSYFPVFVTSRQLNAEKDHVEGFAPEVAWVTKSGDSEMPEPIALRPTSETIMYPYFSKWIRSHRDLPLRLNQWSNVVRWEFKYPTPFIRSREFLWQEGHSAFATYKEAEKEVFEILDLYARVYEELLAVPVVKGRKTEVEKFAGGYYTTTVETYIPLVGRGVQGATSHCLGQNFAHMFNITYEGKGNEGDDPEEKKHEELANKHRIEKEKAKQASKPETENKEVSRKRYVWQNSWGLTTRTIGVMVMVHSDDKGLVCPPRVAPIQVVIVPLFFNKEDVNKAVRQRAHEIGEELTALGVRVEVDDRDNYNPGFKYNHWELRGVCLRLELGPQDYNKKEVACVQRHDGKRFSLSWDELKEKVPAVLEQIQKDMFEKAKKVRDEHQRRCLTWSDLLAALNSRCTALAPHCHNSDCEKDIKKRTGEAAQDEEEEEADAQETGVEKLTGAAKSLCIPLEQPELPAGTKCIGCGKDAVNWTLFGRSY